MTPSCDHIDIPFDGPSAYRIVVQGQIDEYVFECLGAMQISTQHETDHSTITILTGPVMDQAELVGIINSLYEMHLSIQSVENMLKKRQS